jgi:MtrB/PioB family decaheme-associated outer membrane protein
MSLAGTLQQVDLETQRKRLGVGGSWTAQRDWEYAVNFRHETKDGMKRTAGSFFVNASELVEPVDYVTDQVDASASYTGKNLQMKFAYYGSTFRNSNSSLTWDDPYTSVVGESAGQLALPPDNQFHQILASAGYQFSDRTRASADVAIGRMTQNDSFLASTVTPAVFIPGGIPALPRSSLDGRANTLDVGLKLSSAVSDRLRLNGALTYNDRDNRTPQATYAAVTTDMFLEAPRTNLPYSFTQERLKLSADYRASASTKASIGYDYDAHKRTFLEVDTTHENTLWGKVGTRLMDKLDLSLKYEHGERRNSGYQVVTAITPPENPLLRKFNMANRTRDTGKVRADFAAAENVNIGLGYESSEDKYSDSTIGLLNGKDSSLYGDVSFTLSESTSLHAYANHQEIKSRQAGSQTPPFTAPDWSGENKDKIDSFGLGVKHAAIKDKLDIGADYTYMRTNSDIVVNTGVSNPPFPNLSTSLNSLKLYADYRLKESVSLQAGYWYERYDSRDWRLDGVAPNTIPNVLALGLQAPQYRVNVIRLAVRYKF